jgi:hypothetical protein
MHCPEFGANCTHSAPKIGANYLHVFSHLGCAIQLDKSYIFVCRLIGGTGPSYSCSHCPTNSWLMFNGTVLIYLIKFNSNISDILIK